MRRKLLFFLGFVVLVTAAYLVVPEDFDSQLFWASFKGARLWWVAGSVMATFLGYVMRALRWQALLAPLKRVSFVSLITANIVGFGAIFTLGRAGEVVRPVWISRQESLSVIATATSIVVERVFDLMILIVLFVVGALWIDLPEATRASLGGLGTPWQLIAFVVVALTSFFLLHRYADALTRMTPFPPLRRLMRTLTWGLAATSTRRGFATVSLYSILLWMVATLQFWLMLEGLNLSYPISASVLIVVVSSLGSIVQVPGIGGGFQAGFILCATAVLGIAAEVAIAASLMVWFLMTLPTILVTAGYMLWKGVSVRDLRVQTTALSTEKP